ncbi:hypothetical protein D3C87_578040 [compost metagenome]
MAQGDQVGEQPDDGLGIAVGAARHGRADHHVLAGRETCDEQREQTFQADEQRGAGLARQTPQTVALGGAQVGDDLGAGVVGDGRARLVGNQAMHGRRVVQQLTPERGGVRHLAVVDQGALPLGIVAVGDRQGRQGGDHAGLAGGVQLTQFAH